MKVSDLLQEKQTILKRLVEIEKEIRIIQRECNHDDVFMTSWDENVLYKCNNCNKILN